MKHRPHHRLIDDRERLAAMASLLETGRAHTVHEATMAVARAMDPYGIRARSISERPRYKHRAAQARTGNHDEEK
jgi:DNA polymerase III epsilon subunit-like protein